VKRFYAVVALALAACDSGEGDIGVGMDSGGSVDTGPDTDEGDAGALTVTYTLRSWEADVSCADAGLSTLQLVAEGAGEPIAADFPCDDQPIRLADVPSGSWTVSLHGDHGSDEGPFFAGESSVQVDGDTEVDVTVNCDENGWDDGCGGA
jgi:hypothetical protein